MKIIFTKKEFDELKANAETRYKNFEGIYCPYLGQKVTFNTKGLDHIKMKRWNHARSDKDQFMRLKLLHLVPDVLKSSHTLQGIREKNQLERIRTNSRWEERMIRVVYYEFISVQNIHNGGQCRIRVVLKRTENNDAYFWSVIPYWKQGMHGKEMFEGNPEED